MRIAEVPNGKRKNSPDIRIWNGLNRSQGAADGEVIDCVGLSTKMWPAMSAADGRTRIGEWENATDVYETDGHLVVIDDNKLYYDGTFLSNVGNQKKQFAEIGRKLVVWPDKIYINLNTGEMGSLGAEINGKGKIQKGGQITLVATPGQSSTKGSMTLDDVFGGEALWEENYQHWYPHYGAYMKLYTNLSYASGWLYDGTPQIMLPTMEGEVGDSKEPTTLNYFIGSAPETKTHSNDWGWTEDSNYYGKITKITITAHSVSYADRLVDWDGDGVLEVIKEKSKERYSYRYDYEVYERTDLDLTKLFEPGDIVSVSGHKLEYNNQEAVKINGVSRYDLSVDAAFVTKANYFNVDYDRGAGTYLLATRTSAYEDVPYGVTFTTERTLREGEQLFVVSDPDDSGFSNQTVYAYDPQTKTLEAFPGEQSNSSASLLDARNNVYNASQDNPMAIERKMPDMAYVCERDNRLYGVSNAEESKIFNSLTGKYETVTARVLHASELGQPTRWNTSNGTAADSFAVAVAGEGDFTGIVSYSGSVIAFKEDRMYKLTGDYPAEFYLRSYSVDGVKKNCHKSLVIINEVLYYLSPYGVMSYSGGVPGLISYNLDLLRFQDAVAGRDRTRYYISMEDPENGYMIYSYDTVRDLWVIERKEQATGIERVGDYAYACIDGKIYKMADELSQEETTWMALLPETDEGIFEKKRYQNARLIADVQGSLTVSCRQNDHEEWQTLGTITEKGKKIHNLPMDTIRCDRIQFKLEGEGKATIWAFERQFTVGSER